jgi:biotin transporter BioY
MIHHWTGIVFGWPFIATALGLFVIGLIRRRSWLMLVGNLFAAPVCLYLGGTPRFGLEARLVLLMNVIAVWALARGWRWVSAALLAPFLILSAFVTVMLTR